MSNEWDVIIIGAGAAGLMCAQTAGYRGKRVLLIDHVNRAGKKILMSGGGRCNFTHLDAQPRHYRSRNPHFCISALKRYTPQDFLELVERHGIEYVEKTPGQLFCAGSAKEIVAMLLTECEWAGVSVQLGVSVEAVAQTAAGFTLTTSEGPLTTPRLVVATGGYSIPTLGATGFGFDLARQFGLAVWPTSPSLVPFTLTSHWKARFAELSGLSTDVHVRCGQASAKGAMLLTHRGVSGPAMLDISGDWSPGDTLSIDWLPGVEAMAALVEARQQTPKRTPGGWLAGHLPKRLAQALASWFDGEAPLAEYSNARLAQLAEQLNAFALKPAGTEGWRTAEVTLGGIDTTQLSSKDMSVTAVPGLYFIGEVLDVTGPIGGYNFQWAWASGVACGQAI